MTDKQCSECGATKPMTDQPEIAPCPRCGSECYVDGRVLCRSMHCEYRLGGGSRAADIAAHNRIATAIPVERVREMWRERGYTAFRVDTLTHSASLHMYGIGMLEQYWHRDTLADCLHAALQAALETSDGE